MKALLADLVVKNISISSRSIVIPYPWPSDSLRKEVRRNSQALKNYTLCANCCQLQWNLDLTKCQAGEIGSSCRGFVISRPRFNEFWKNKNKVLFTSGHSK